MVLSNSCLVLPVVVKQQQEEISRNHVPSLFAVPVDTVKILTRGLTMNRFFSFAGHPGEDEDAQGPDVSRGRVCQLQDLGAVRPRHRPPHLQDHQLRAQGVPQGMYTGLG